MSTSFKKTYVAPFQKSSVPLSPDTVYWKRFTSPILLKEVNLIDYIDVSPVEPHFLAVTCSTRVQLYHPITRMVHKNYNRFREAAYGGVFRNDGKLLLAGSDECAVKLFEVTSKNLLRVFKGHQRAVHRCAFFPTGADNQIVSFSDDKSVIQWDIPTEKLIQKYEGHSDYVRSGSVVESNPNLFISGSYDQTVKLWDRRDSSKEMISVNHGAPVESVLISPSGSLLFTAGATEIRVWDCLAGGRLLTKISQHHKTITCLRFASNGKRLISSSLDRHVKIYDMNTFQVLHTFDYSSPILSMGITPNDKTLAVGMSDGIVAISRKEDPMPSSEDVEGSGSAAADESIRVEQEKRKKKNRQMCHDYVVTDAGVREVQYSSGKRYDMYIRKFRYSKALDEVLNDYYFNQHPAATVAVIQELIRRDGLKTAVAGRQGKQLTRLLRFLIKHLRRQRFMRVLLQVAATVCDIYAKEVGQDHESDQMFLRLYDEINGEVAYMTELLELQGSLDTILTAKDLVSSSNKTSNSQLTPILPGITSTSSTGDKTNPNSATDSTGSAAGTRLQPSEQAMEAVVVKLKA